MTLYHYTCEHGRKAIGRRGWLTAGLDGLLWLTDLEVPVREALGLTSHLLTCDRIAYRYEVELDESSDVVPYVAVRRHLDPMRRDGLESAPGVLVQHWYVTSRSLFAVLS